MSLRPGATPRLVALQHRDFRLLWWSSLATNLGLHMQTIAVNWHVYRMVGVNMIFFMGGPQLGEVRAGLVAAALGAPLAIITGGLAAALLAAWPAWRDPHLRRYTAEMGYRAVAEKQE